MKRCLKCHIEKYEGMFWKDSTTSDGFNSWCIECKRQYGKEYRKNNKEKVYIMKKMYVQNNREKVRATWNNFYNNKKSDLNFKLAINLRARLRCALKNNQKSGSAVDDLGCSIQQLKLWLESKFQLGMNWSNYGIGKGKWNIDHIIPLASFDLTDRKQLLEACNYKNLQPMWAEENIKKKNKIVR